ncbi:MAG: hypothetical protein BWZ10_02009 [candidate division BRC1 bacterium ADurb.BinA364]|nr:MAG: hypothetical protein BWZ10_02009 [candidate division BRC1 bacterium ADurb.BinA364]
MDGKAFVERAQGTLDGAADIGSAARFQLFDPCSRAGAIGAVGGNHAFAEGLDIGGKADDVEPVLGPEPTQALLQSIARLVHLAVRGHGAGCVQDEGVCAFGGFRLLHLHFWGDQRHEAARGVRIGAIRQSVQANIVGRDSIHQRHVAPAGPARSSQRSFDLFVAFSRDFNLVAGRIDGFDRRAGADRKGKAQQLALAGLAKGRLLAHGINVGGQSAIERQNLRELQLDFLIALSRDRKNPHAEGVAVEEFEQPGIAHAAHDIFINACGFFFLQRFRPHRPPVDIEREIGDLRTRRLWKKEMGFQRPGVRIVECLRHLGARGLVGDLDCHIVARQSQRRQPWLDRQQESGGAGRSQAKAGETANND